MSRYEKLQNRILSGRADANIEFAELCALLTRLGFSERIRGSHNIYTRPDVTEIINLQPSNGKAKPYQVRQVRGLIVKYRLGVTDVD
ncbi:MAG: type II toxin-antitoxin system HicA family toxin [Halofilum sp. (in: g-proteobacteria)]